MSEPVRIPPQEVREKISVGSAMLVCAYDDAQKFKNNHLQGAVSISEFKTALPALSKESEIIFYCA